MANENMFELHAPRGANKKPKRVDLGGRRIIKKKNNKGKKGPQPK